MCQIRARSVPDPYQVNYTKLCKVGNALYFWVLWTLRCIPYFFEADLSAAVAVAEVTNPLRLLARLASSSGLLMRVIG